MSTLTFDNTLYVLDACCLRKAWQETHPNRMILIMYDRTEQGWEFVTTETILKRPEQYWDDLLSRYVIHVREHSGKLHKLPDMFVRRRLGTTVDQIKDFIFTDPTRDLTGLTLQVKQEWPVFFMMKR